MAEIIKCPECGKSFTCDPDGDCWCKAYPIVKIPEKLKGKSCLCSCMLDKLQQEQNTDTDDEQGSSGSGG